MAAAVAAVLLSGRVDAQQPDPVSVSCGERTGTITVNTESRGGYRYQDRDGDWYEDEFEGMGLAFESTDGVESCCWIQFATITVVLTNGQGETSHLEGSSTYNIGEVQYSTDDETYWHLDTMNPPEMAMLPEGESRDRLRPCYGPAGFHQRTPIRIAILDIPSVVNQEMIDDTVAAGRQTVRIDATGTLEAYLVCDDQICARVTWTAESSVTPDGVGEPVYRHVRTETENITMNESQVRLIQRRYPSQTWAHSR